MSSRAASTHSFSLIPLYLSNWSSSSSSFYMMHEGCLCLNCSNKRLLLKIGTDNGQGWLGYSDVLVIVLKHDLTCCASQGPDATLFLFAC
jgi:hypothetical protein